MGREPLLLSRNLRLPSFYFSKKMWRRLRKPVLGRNCSAPTHLVVVGLARKNINSSSKKFVKSLPIPDCCTNTFKLTIFAIIDVIQMKKIYISKYYIKYESMNRTTQADTLSVAILAIQDKFVISKKRCAFFNINR